MTAFLKIDECNICRRAIPWEWAPAVVLQGKVLAGTGVWRSQLMNRQCPACITDLEREREQRQCAQRLRNQLVELLAGEKPYRQFTFERYRVTPGNQLAHQGCKNFNPAVENLYLWGPCGVGKTHLAYAAARHSFEETLSVAILLIWQLSRKMRMKDPEQEQEALDRLISTDILVLDDVGHGSDTAYSRQVFQEILDTRHFRDRGGLIVTSQYSLDQLAAKMGDDAIPSRLAGTCSVIEIRGTDGRLVSRKDQHDAA
jgi:DNA replication protein DnaC